MIDISAYLEHIQYQGQREATWQALHELHVKHTQAIPFEALSPFTGTPVSLDIDALMDKFTRQKRGGYCYEHNSVFQHVLREMGFTVEGLAARVRLNAEDGVLTPRSHMLLLVDVEGETFIADTGFGGLTLTAPIRFATDIVQDTPHGPYRLLARDDAYCLQTKTRDEWQDLYIFDLARQHPPDYEVFNWYTSTHPSSHFVNNLIAARPAPNGRHALLNRQYSFYHLNGRVEKKALDSVTEIIHVLEDEFRISTSGIPNLNDKLATMLAA
ncbi:MAG TPA: arylamine N-acetyltransferase [Burkholderiaceae bacterium]|nr:arylamine N-acetyltransferase [Burkholderiaceae bacterium]